MEERRSPAHIDLRQLLETHTDAYWIWDMATDTAHWSPSLYQLLSVHPESNQPGMQGLLELVHPDDLPRVHTLIEAQKKRAAPYRIELRFRKRNGEVLWMDCIGETFLDEERQPTRVVGFHLDITERKRAEQLSSTAAQVLELVATGASQAEVFALLAETIERNYPAIRASIMLLDTQKQRLHVACAPSLPDFYTQAIDGVEIGPKVVSFASAAYTGSRDIAENISTHPYWKDYRELALRADLSACWSEPIFSPRRQILGAFALYYHDARAPQTEEIELVETAAQLAGVAIERIQTSKEQQRVIKQLEQTVEKRSAQLRATNKQLQQITHAANSANSAKTKLLTAASHDLRQPLQSLHAYAATLQKLSEQKECQEIAIKIQRAVSVMVAEVDELLSINKLEAGLIDVNKTDIPVQALFERLLAKFQPAAVQKSLHLRTVNCEGSVHSDPSLLASILSNLLGNAIRYTDAGNVLLSCERQGEQLRIDVIDTGAGIAKHDLERIFDDFYQINSEARDYHKGLGLGLPIVKQFAALLNHPLDVTSSRGKGSRFSITVPYTPTEGSSNSDKDMPHAFNRLSLLLVDDDAAVLDATGVFLRALGAKVMAAKSGEEALAKAATCIDLDLVICDFQLPGTHGVELIKRIRTLLGKQVPALIMTGDVALTAPAASALSNYHWLQKPVDLDQLMTLIEQSVGAKNKSEIA
ncbi:MAG: ATP-binding protein [Pseudomonadales bacterium]